jgi:8-oxo-dGTP pyrophosphatase MutT (NUDIX family)
MTERPLRATVSQKAALFDGEGHLLVLQRPDGVWEFPGGRLGAEEAPLVGLRREVREETTLDVTVGPPVFTAAWRNDADEGRFAVVYRCETDETDVRLSDEHVDARWVDIEEARDLLTDRRVTALAQTHPEDAPPGDGWHEHEHAHAESMSESESMSKSKSKSDGGPDADREPDTDQARRSPGDKDPVTPSKTKGNGKRKGTTGTDGSRRDANGTDGTSGSDTT